MRTLQKGDTIGFFSPSSPATATARVRYERAKAFVQQQGYKVKEGKLTGLRDCYRSGTIKERAEEFNDLLYDPNVACLMSTIGGSNSNALLPYIDYGYFKKNPKIVVGYSDATAILLGIYAQTGVSTFYGPACVASLGELPPYVNETWLSFHNMVARKNTYPFAPSMPIRWTEEYLPWETQSCSKKPCDNHWVSTNPQIVTGRLIGGNLNTMQGFWGSPYMPTIKRGDILFIEDSLKTASTVERGFSFLKVNGVFDTIGGIVLGKHELFDDESTNRTPLDILLEVLNGQNLPILSDYDACHTHPMITLPIGAMVELNTMAGKLTLSNDGIWGV